MAEIPNLMTTRQVAHALGMTVAQVNSMRKRGEINSLCQLGRGAHMWDPDEVRRVLRNGDARKRVFRQRRDKKSSYDVGVHPVYPRFVRPKHAREQVGL